MLVIGATAGKDRIAVAKHGSKLIVTLQELTHGHLHAHLVVVAKSVTKIIVVGQRRLDPVQLSHGLHLPVQYIKPVAPRH
ncbi:MAG: hypothetical protein JOZ99_15680 [Actinobacteria bacterium]|nr:hypothetical protein [Actinomycetota bacterium]